MVVNLSTEFSVNGIENKLNGFLSDGLLVDDISEDVFSEGGKIDNLFKAMYLSLNTKSSRLKLIILALLSFNSKLSDLKSISVLFFKNLLFSNHSICWISI